ncbi:hypothetical protein P7K49_007060 [Saguinus oedipus]|uniref:Ribosome biogenesis regulatory protein n=1 Tax=Saguinus oedipus TaxID=9490 RepID=A0ABQ9W498_SAGOE|nr:hypothetical protein P7K49_007060 [Saguinus oedipus]
MPGNADPLEDQFAKRIQAKKELVAKNELNWLRNLARMHKMHLPSAAGLRPTGHQTEKKNQLELLRVTNSKKPQLDVTRATNKQMREDNQEEAAKRRKMRQRGKKKGLWQGLGGKRKEGPPSQGGKRKGGLGGEMNSGPPGFGDKRKGQHPGGKRRK